MLHEIKITHDRRRGQFPIEALQGITGVNVDKVDSHSVFTEEYIIAIIVEEDEEDLLGIVFELGMLVQTALLCK